LNLNYIYLLETMYNILLRFVYALCVCYFACNCNDITKDHDIAEIMLKLTLNTNQSINQSYNKKLHKLAKLVSHP
jgi:predicted transcriptional regulator